MSKSVLIQITISESKEYPVFESRIEVDQISEHLFYRYDGSLRWEIESIFSKLGEVIANKIDPT